MPAAMTLERASGRMEIRAVTVKLWGELACFTRPEMKVERVSYPVMTPSAARGALEAIFWRPQFSWRVREIRVVKMGRVMGFVRNEVTEKATLGPRGQGVLVADDHRAQRHTLALRDVAYVVEATLWPREGTGPGAMAGFRDQFLRRVVQGRCFQTPYLGCREFTASFGPGGGSDVPAPLAQDLGMMLFDLRYGDGRHPPAPVFFPARLAGGVLHVPQEFYDETEVAA